MVVAGELQIAGAHQLRVLLRADRAFPIQRAARQPCIVLLVIEQRLDLPLLRSDSQLPGHRIAGARSRRAPVSARQEGPLIGPETVHLSCRIAQCGAGPIGLPVATSNPKCHQGAAVTQVQADPVPAVRLLVEVAAGPFVIEPGFTGHDFVARAACDAAADGEVRLAVVIAGRLARRTLLTVAAHAVEHGRLRDRKALMERQVFGCDAGLIDLAARPGSPSTDPAAVSPTCACASPRPARRTRWSCHSWPRAGSLMAQWAISSWCGANALGLASASTSRVRKKVI